MRRHKFRAKERTKERGCVEDSLERDVKEHTVNENKFWECQVTSFPEEGKVSGRIVVGDGTVLRGGRGEAIEKNHKGPMTM